MTMHVAFELGIASVVSYQRFADGLPTSEDIARTQSSDFRKVYMEFVQQVFDMHMYDEFAQDGWTAALAWQTNYYPDDDPTKRPVVSWRAEGQLLYSNWLNYYVYQTTPYDLAEM